MKAKYRGLSLLTLALTLSAPAAHASRSFFEMEEALPLESGKVAVPVLVLHHPDGSREALPLEQQKNQDETTETAVETSSNRIEYPFQLGQIGSESISLSFVGGIEAGTLEGLAATLGVFIGEQQDSMLGHVRTGVLVEFTPGTDATKVGVGYTIGSSPVIGFNLNATYIKTYGSLLLGSPASDLVGVELGGEFTVIHWFVGVLDSLQTGQVRVNAGAGVRFY